MMRIIMCTSGEKYKRLIGTEAKNTNYHIGQHDTDACCYRSCSVMLDAGRLVVATLSEAGNVLKRCRALIGYDDTCCIGA